MLREITSGEQDLSIWDFWVTHEPSLIGILKATDPNGVFKFEPLETIVNSISRPTRLLTQEFRGQKRLVPDPAHLSDN